LDLGTLEERQMLPLSVADGLIELLNEDAKEIMKGRRKEGSYGSPLDDDYDGPESIGPEE